MATLDSGQSANGASSSSHTLTNGVGFITVEETTSGDDRWYIGLQVSPDAGTTWRNYPKYLRKAQKDQILHFELPIGAAVRTFANGLDGSVLKILVLG